MGLGILEDTHLAHVPGTVDIIDDDSASTHVPIDSNLKCDRSGPVPIILTPQPSDDPNDPLNWPLWRRDLILTILSFVAVLCSTTSSLMAANALVYVRYYGITFTEFALLTGYLLCGVGVAGILCVPTARVWGKRHLLLLGTVLMLVSCAWAGGSGKNHASIVWARVFQGVALAPFESLVNACVGDLYFVHERGKRMALSNVALFGAAFLAPVVVGKMTLTIGWTWTFYILAILLAFFLPLMIFFVPETAYRRANYLNTDYDDGPGPGTGSGTDSHLPLAGVSDGSQGEETKRSLEGKETNAASVEARPPPEVPPKDSFWRSLRLFSGRKTDENFFKLVLRPIPLLFHPGILWACLTQGVMIGWTVLIGVVLAALFTAPPLFLSAAEIGYLYTGAFIGSILGLVLSGLLSDWITRIMIKLNKGRYEPEFRIPLVFFQLLFSGAGLYGFGIVVDNVGAYTHGKVIVDVFLALVIMGMVMGAVASALYIVDAHRQIAVEAFTCLLIFKNFFSFVITFYAYHWIVESSIRDVFIAIATVQVAVCLLSIPMYIFGKRNRSYFARHDILKKLHLW